MSTLYQRNCEELIKKGIVSSDQIYDYSKDILADVYEQLFEFAYGHLKTKEKTLGFPPTHFFYKSDLRTNAFASSGVGYKLICFNLGAIENMFNFFEARADVLQKAEYQSFHKLIRLTKNPTHITLFQFFTLFLFYHEYAHLIQHIPDASFYSDEISDSIEQSSEILNNHCKELDADWLGSSNVALTIVQFLSDTDEQFNGSTEELSDLVSMCIASVYSFFLKAAHFYPEVYYMEHNHPHPYVRIIYITQFIIETLPVNLPPEFSLDKSAILRKGMKLSEDLLEGQFGNSVGSFARVWVQSADEMEAHIRVIIDHALGKSELNNTIKHSVQTNSEFSAAHNRIKNTRLQNYLLSKNHFKKEF